MLLLHLSVSQSRCASHSSHSLVLSLITLPQQPNVHCNDLHQMNDRIEKFPANDTHTHTHNNFQLRCNATSGFLFFSLCFFFLFKLVWTEQFDAQHSSSNNYNYRKKSDMKTAKKTVKIAFTLDVICKVLIWKIFQNKNQLNHHFQSFQAPITAEDFNLQPILCSKCNQIVRRSSC